MCLLIAYPHQYQIVLPGTELSLIIRLAWKAKKTEARLNNMVSIRGDSK